MTTKILNTLEGEYITINGLRAGRVVDHEVYEEPAVAAWQAARDARTVYVGKSGQKGTPKGQASKWG